MSAKGAEENGGYENTIRLPQTAHGDGKEDDRRAEWLFMHSPESQKGDADISWIA